MEPILVDTSIWIDWFKNTITPQTQLVESYLVNNAPLYITPTILQEVLQGIRFNSQYEQVKESLLAITILTFDVKEAAIGAADLYRSLRKKGVTIRKSNDCLIAYYAIRVKIPILHNDSDFDAIAQHTPLSCLNS